MTIFQKFEKLARTDLDLFNRVNTYNVYLNFLKLQFSIPDLIETIDFDILKKDLNDV